MAGEDQERFEDYLELERYIEELQAGHAAHPPADLTPERARIYRMAALFRSAPPEAADPRPEFVASLRAQLLAENAEDDQEDTVPRMPVVRPPEQPSMVQEGQEGQEGQEEQKEQPPIINQPDRKPQRARFFSRRSLLGGSAVAAASLVVGTGIGAAFEKNTTGQIVKGHATSTATQYTSMPIVPQDVAVPHFVATLAELGDGAVPFSAGTLVGYVIVSDGDDDQVAKGDVVAMSAACTHMGCIVQWQDADRRFHCPCHGGIFTEYGKPGKGSPIRYLASLPRLETRIIDGKVYVMVPRSPSKSTSV
jgi:Rieske Fe-S protein